MEERGGWRGECERERRVEGGVREGEVGWGV